MQWNRKNTKGYSWNKANKKYDARIIVDKEFIYLGGFDTSEEAHNVYLRAKKKYHKI